MALPPVSLLVHAALLLGLAFRAWAADDLEVSAQRAGDLVEVRAQATVQAPLPLVWSTLTDYERLPEFIPGIRRSRILSRQGASTIVEQSGEARFLFLTVPIEVTVESTERPPNIEVRRIAGTLRHLQGQYETEVLPGDPPRVQLRWVGRVAPESDLPPLVGEALIRRQLQDQFSGMVQEIERRVRLRRAAAAPGAENPAGVRPPAAPAPAATTQSPPAPAR